MKKNNKGFTLIELLAVIIIISLIISLAIPSITSIIKDTEAKQLKSYQDLIVSEVELYVNTNKNKTKDIQTTTCGYTTEYLNNNSAFKNKEFLFDKKGNLIKGCVTYDKENNNYIFQETCTPCS